MKRRAERKRQRVLEILRKEPQGMTRAEIGEKMQVDPRGLSPILQQLIEKGLLSTREVAGGRPSRKRKLYLAK